MSSVVSINGGGALVAANVRGVRTPYCISSCNGLRSLNCGAAFGRLLGKSGVKRRVVVRSMSASQSETEDLIKSKNEHNPVVVYSKTWCPYCSRVKGLFNKIGVKFLGVELNELVDEAHVQAALKRLTRQSTVPNVFIGGKHIGGCDDTMRLHKEGKLIQLLTEAGAQIEDLCYSWYAVRELPDEASVKAFVQASAA